MAKKNNVLDIFLTDVAPIFYKHKISSDIGVFLLHKHNDLTSGKIMLEHESEYLGEPALITAETTISDTSIPARWAVLSRNDYTPLEYTGDHLAAAALTRLQSNTEFLEEFASLIYAHDVNNLFGLCLADRGFFQSPPSSSAKLVEESYPGVGNVVRWTLLDNPDNNLIQTIWTFPATQGPACVPMCKRYCVPRSPGHAGEHYPIHGIIA